MRKKHFIALFATISFLFMTTMITHAAGWEQRDASWYYRKSDGQLAVNEWRNGADNIARWLGTDGRMVSDAWVDGNNSYVDVEGRRVENDWIKLQTVVGDRQITEFYFFDSKGRKVTNAWKKVGENQVYLGDDGTLQKGWIEDGVYYTDENGFMVRGWQKLFPPDCVAPDEVLPFTEAKDDRVWYFFGENGKKFTSGAEGKVKLRTIDNVKYCFDDEGMMLTGWVNMTTKDVSETTIKDFMYFNSDGSQRLGWFSLNPPKNIMQTYENEVEWFYFDNNGVPKASADTVLRTTDFVKIQDKTFLFANNGVPVYGLVRIYNGKHYDIYYFGNANQRNLQKGMIEIMEPIGDVVQYYFDNKGKGFTGVKDDKLFYMGKLQASNEEGKYRVISLSLSGTIRNYVVNRQGKLVKNTKVKSEDRTEYKTNASGILVSVNGVNVEAGERFENPTEPDID